MKTILFSLLSLIAILLFWNIFQYLILRKSTDSKEKAYFELNAKLNFIVATGSLFIILMSFLGWNIKDEILKKSEKPIGEMILKKSSEIDSLIESKNILKAGIFIVNNLVFVENKKYMFEDLQTIDNKHLPVFNNAPKLLLNTNTGENLRVKEITNTYFILGKPITKVEYMAYESDESHYPSKLEFDVWIADYK